MLKKNEAIEKLNQLGADRVPFDFYCDFLGEDWCVTEHSDGIAEKVFQLEIGREDFGDRIQNSEDRIQKVEFRKHPVSFEKFKSAFDLVVGEINIGNSFLTNLTFQTPIETNLTLKEIFRHSRARFKLLVPEQFVVFSPETFVKIKENKICSYPMKGTIDADLPDAANHIMGDIKESAEHVTIVDLIRNDLSQVARDVKVTRFRFIDEIHTNEKRLLQVSSEVVGQLEKKWNTKLGTILSSLLPAGSISGAPKPETLRIINDAEDYDRGFYTGICGRFDGKSLDTGVMIRFIKQENDQLFYCSGGGITSHSEAYKEYQEMVDKVYLPL